MARTQGAANAGALASPRTPPGAGSNAIALEEGATLRSVWLKRRQHRAALRKARAGIDPQPPQRRLRSRRLARLAHRLADARAAVLLRAALLDQTRLIAR